MDLSVSRPAEDKIRAGMSGLLMLADNFDAFAARVLAARSAVRSLDLIYYLWHDDHSGRLLMEEVVKAAERGVRVRILLDDINPRSGDAAYLALNSHRNIEVRLFNPSGPRRSSIARAIGLVSRLFALMRRMHNKAWIVDGRVAIVGGRNIGDAYFDAAETNFRDLDLLLLGPAVKQTEEIFEAFWSCGASQPIEAVSRPRSDVRSRLLRPSDVPTHIALLNGIEGGSIDEFIAATSKVHWTAAASVISDPPEKVLTRNRQNWLMKELLPVIRASRRSLQIVSPYFIPGPNGASILAGLVENGVDVAVLTNSLAATDVAAVHGAYAKYRVGLLKSGVKLYELQPFDRQPKISVFGSKGASLHTKAFTVDDETAFVGSFNFDPRSVSVNTEMGVLVQDRHVAAELRRWIEREKAPEASYRPFLRGSKLGWEGDEDGGMREYAWEPESTWSRRLLARLVRLLPIESQL